MLIQLNRLMALIALCVLMAQSAQAQAEPEVTRSDSLSEQMEPVVKRNERIAKKVAVGTFSGIVFTGMAMGAMDRIEEPKGDPDADAYRTIGFLLAGGAIGCSVGFPFGVSSVDPYDSLPITLLAGVIPGLAGYSLLRVSQQHGETAFLLMYVVPVINSLIASERWRKPPQDRRVSFGLASTLNGGLSASITLYF